MCRGCRIEKGGKNSVDEYLIWLDEYHRITCKMKLLEKKVLSYNQGIVCKEDSKDLDVFHKKLVRVRKNYAKAEKILDKI